MVFEQVPSKISATDIIQQSNEQIELETVDLKKALFYLKRQYGNDFQRT